MDFLWIAIAFSCGFVAKQMKLPPLVGYLAAGFGLHAYGITPSTFLDSMSDIGVTLLLFTIGLKLNIKSLLKPEVYASATVHMSTIALITTFNCLLFSYLGIANFVGLSLQAAALIGFAVSFSSTVFVVKILEEKGEMKTRHGQIAIGILVIQDIFAVAFVTLATDKIPSIWALTLLALPLLQPLASRLLQRCGHGELLPLAGFFLALGSGELFELVGLKSHLGALVVAAMLSGHSKASELSKSLLAFKDIFLIGFFLSIGFTALPTLNMVEAAVIMAVALPFKAALFFLFLTQLKLRSRSAFLTAMSLSNYSEFGLIVCAASVTQGILSKEWLVIMALAVAFSFVFSSIANTFAHSLYTKWYSLIHYFEKEKRLVEDQFEVPNADSEILIVGMGRVGLGAYDTLISHNYQAVCGIDANVDQVNKLRKKGRHLISADAEDPDFWSHTNLDNIQLIMLAMPNYLDILEVVKQLKLANYTGKISGIAKYNDEKRKLEAAGVDSIFNFYAGIGAGFAEESLSQIHAKK